MILQLNILPTVEKAYYYELINYSKPESDIKIYCNEKKHELLESIGINLGEHPELSLRHYLQISKLSRALSVSIDNGIPINPVHYTDNLLHNK